MIGFLASIRRRTFAISGCFLLLTTLLTPVDLFCQDAKEARLKKDALAIPLGWPVQVNLKNRDVLRGRMGQISDQGLVLQYLNAGTIEERTVAFTDMKRVYRSTNLGPTTKRTFLAPIVTFAVIFGAELALLR